MAATVNAATVAWRLIAKHAQGSAGGQMALDADQFDRPLYPKPS